ncbi:MAG: hypothetical protein WCA46_01275 [Actinocatenispora sp.]
MRNKIATVAATVLLAAAGALATASSASAGTLPPPGGGSWDHTWTTTDSAHGGTVYVEENGDMVYLCDTAGDSYAPRVKIAARNSAGEYVERYTMTASDGNGSCTGHSAPEGGVYDLTEGSDIGVTIWLGPNYEHQSTHYYLNDH